MEKYCRAGQVTDDNMAQVHCMLDTLGYTLKQYVILIALQLQECLQERNIMLYV